MLDSIHCCGMCDISWMESFSVINDLYSGGSWS